MSKPRTKYLYHLTDPKSLDDILTNGLKPKIGPRSKLVCEIEPRIYLCDKKSIPYWSALLDKYTVIRIAMPVDAFNKCIQSFDYSYYSEYLMAEPIPANWICKSKADTVMSEDEYNRLALSIIDTISDVCVEFANYITYLDKEPDFALEKLSKVEFTIKTCKFVLPHISFDGITAPILSRHLHYMGDNGMYTLCDRYDADSIFKLHQKENPYLYELLGTHEKATNNTKWLYSWLKTTFPRRLRVNTGGWTG